MHARTGRGMYIAQLARADFAAKRFCAPPATAFAKNLIRVMAVILVQLLMEAYATRLLGHPQIRTCPVLCGNIDLVYACHDFKLSKEATRLLRPTSFKNLLMDLSQ